MTTVAISGTPATGKTSVAKIAGEKLGWKVIELNRLAHEKKLYSGYDEKRQSHIVDMERIQEEIGRKKGNLIIESHYAHEIKCDFVVVLRANPDEIRKRASEKSWRKEKTEENVLAEIMEVCKQEALGSAGKVFEIDTTGKTARKVAGEVVRIIRMMEKLKKAK